MNINLYQESEKNLLNNYYYVFALNVGNRSRINRFVPITRVKVTKHPSGHIYFNGENKAFKNYENNCYCQVYSTLQEAELEFQKAKNYEIDKLEESINDIIKLQNRIKEL